MKVLVAGGTGAIGKPLLRYLNEAGHEAIALARSPKGSAELHAAGADQVVGNVLDGASLSEVVRRVRPAVIINQLTSLPKHYTPAEMKAASPRDTELRVKGKCKPAGGRTPGQLPALYPAVLCFLVCTRAGTGR